MEMDSWLLLVLTGLAMAAAVSAGGPYQVPEEGDAELENNAPFTWEIAPDGRKFRVYTHETNCPHGFNKKVFIKRTPNHIVKYIRLKKCGCHIKTTRKVWVGKHRALWYNGPRQAKVNFVHAPKKTCRAHRCGHY